MRRSSVRGLTLLVVLALCTTACSARHLREAQNAFNEAARAENQERATTLAGGAGPSSTSAASGYRMALTLLNQELDQNRSSLQKERLLGSALMLKALSLWRVADLDEDPRAGEELTKFLGEIRALSSGKGEGQLLGTRDQVLLYALPGLRDHDLGLRAPTLETAGRFFDSSLTVLDRALETAPPPPNHPVRVYIRLSQLATLRAWKGAVYVFESDPSRRAQQVEPLLARFRTVAKTLEPSVLADPVLRGVVCGYHQAMGLTC